MKIKFYLKDVELTKFEKALYFVHDSLDYLAEFKYILYLVFFAGYAYFVYQALCSAFNR